MKDLSVEKWWVILPLYVLGGLAFGLADHQLGRWVGEFGMKPGLATAASVNVFLPLLVVGLAVARPKLGTAWFGAIALTLAFIFGLAIVYPQAHRGDPVALIRAVPPVLVMACLGYAILGTLSVVLTRSMRKHRLLRPTRAG